MGAPVKNRIADEIVNQLQSVAQEVWQQEIDQLVKLFAYEIKAKDGESWLKQTRARDAAILAKLQQLRELIGASIEKFPGSPEARRSRFTPSTKG